MSDWLSPFDKLLAGSPSMPNSISPRVESPPSTIGTPIADSIAWHGKQSLQDDCAIRCQEHIIELYTGNDPGERLLVSEAFDHHWYVPGGGTPIQDVGNLLDLHGIPTRRFAHADQFALAQELAQGHKVIIGVESGRLMSDFPLLNDLKDFVGLGGSADHAIIVSGIDTSDPMHPQVIVNDPGTGEVCKRYPLAEFMKAWSKSDFFMVATQDPVPPSAPEMKHFDYFHGLYDVFNGILDFDVTPPDYSNTSNVTEVHLPDAQPHFHPPQDLIAEATGSVFGHHDSPHLDHHEGESLTDWGIENV